MLRKLLKEHSIFPYGTCGGCPYRRAGDCHEELRPQLGIPVPDEIRWSYCRNYSCHDGRKAARDAHGRNKLQIMETNEVTLPVTPFGTSEKPTGRFVSVGGTIYSNNGNGNKIYPTGQSILV